METIQLRPYQYKAIDSVRTALNRGQRHIVVEMAAGTGKGMVFAKTVEFLHRTKDYKILVVVGHSAIKKQIISKISTNCTSDAITRINTIVCKYPRLLGSST